MPSKRDRIRISDLGTIFLFEPVGKALAWLRRRTDGTWYAAALVVEHRFAVDLALAARRAGFTLTRGGAS